MATRPVRTIRFKDARRWKDAESARKYGEEVEFSVQYNSGQAQCLILSDADVYEMIIRATQYLRDKYEGNTT